MPLAWHHDLALAVHGVAARAIEGWYRSKARALGITDGKTGMLTVVQRFGSDLALNIHFHSLVLDGVFDACGAFTPIAAPSIDEMEALTATIAKRIARMCERRALDLDDHEPGELALLRAFARSAARAGASKHAPDGIDPDHDDAPDWAGVRPWCAQTIASAWSTCASTCSARRSPIDDCACSTTDAWRSS